MQTTDAVRQLRHMKGTATFLQPQRTTVDADDVNNLARMTQHSDTSYTFSVLEFNTCLQSSYTQYYSK